MTQLIDFTEFFKIIEEVNNHPFTNIVIKAEQSKDGSELPWLPMNNIMCGHIVAPIKYVELMGKLATKLDNFFITPHGQHSQAFYDIRKHGWLSRTGESDSFGPLSSILSPPSREWYVCYG